MRWVNHLGLLLAVLVVLGVGNAAGEEFEHTRRSELRVGMDMDAVQAILGQPDDINPQGDSIWLTYQSESDGLVIRLQVELRDGQLGSWVYEERGPGKNSEPEAKQPPDESTPSPEAAPSQVETPKLLDPPSDGKPLQVASYRHEVLPEDASNRRYRDLLLMHFEVRNNTDRVVVAWKARITFLNPFGDTILYSDWTAATSDIPPGGTDSLGLQFEDNRFDADDGYSKLTAYSSSKVSIRLDNLEVIYAE